MKVVDGEFRGEGGGEGRGGGKYLEVCLAMRRSECLIRSWEM